MAPDPGHLDESRDRDLAGREHEPLVRRFVLALLAVVVVLAALNVFGQAETTSADEGPLASLTVTAPEEIRGGLFFQGRFEVESRAAIGRPTLVLERGWMEGNHLNTIEPAPASERSQDGKLILRFDPIPAGSLLTVWTQWQVNPTNVGRRDQGVTLNDGSTRLAAVSRRVTIFP